MSLALVNDGLNEFEDLSGRIEHGEPDPRGSRLWNADGHPGTSLHVTRGAMPVTDQVADGQWGIFGVFFR
ncbi:MAG: hypothetical protein WBQ26_12420 [Gemmatimonadaceae bacterium]